jgi:hypothetical protein
MLYQLPNGKVIEISTEQYFEMTDEELQYLIAYNYGDTLEDPWFGSVIQKKSPVFDEDEDDDFLEMPSDLTDVTNEDKISYMDIDYKPEED